MAQIKVTASIPGDKPGGPASGEVMYDFGGDLQEMIGLFGEQVVFANAQAQMKVGLQSAIRRGLTPDKEGKVSTPAELQEMADKWTPGDRTVTRKSNVDKAKDLLGTMDANERAELLKALKEAK